MPKGTPGIERTPLTMRLPHSLVDRIDARGQTRTHVIERDLMRYYASLADSKRRLREDFSASELCVLMDVCKDWEVVTESDARLLWARLEDALRRTDVGVTWSIKDGPRFVERVRNMPLVDVFAVLDATFSYWSEDGGDLEEAFSQT